MKEHNDNLNLNIELPSAAPMPETIKSLLRAKRRTRRLQKTGTLAIAASIVLVAISIPTLISANNQTNQVATLKPVLLRFNDPMFQGMDQPSNLTPSTTRWTIGTRLQNNWQNDF